MQRYCWQTLNQRAAALDWDVHHGCACGMRDGRRIKVHLTETCDDDAPHLITDMTPDMTMPRIIQQQFGARGPAPAEHLVDAGYVCADTLVRSQQAQIDLVGPTQPESGWRAKTHQGFAGSYFVLDWDTEQATCPAGHVSVR